MSIYLIHPQLWHELATNVSGFTRLNGKTYFDYVLMNLHLTQEQRTEIDSVETYEDLVAFWDKHNISITHDY